SDLRRLTDTSLSAQHPGVAPDGGTVYFVGTELGSSGRDYTGRNHGLFAVPADGSVRPLRLTDPETVHLAAATGPLRVDADGVLVEVEHRGSVELRRVCPDGSQQAVLAGPRQVAGHAAAPRLGGRTLRDPAPGV